MTALIRQSFERLYYILKVYLVIGLLGALIVVAYTLIVSNSLPTLMSLIGFVLSITAIVLRLESRTLNRYKNIDGKQPATPPESLRTVMLPPYKTELILGDPRTGFFHLKLKTPLNTPHVFAQIGVIKYSRKSAPTWYAVDSIKIILQLTTPYFAFHFGKRYINQIEKTLARA